jgi:hypothetical protein
MPLYKSDHGTRYIATVHSVAQQNGDLTLALPSLRLCGEPPVEENSLLPAVGEDDL